MNAKHISIIVAVVALLAGCAKSPIEEVKPSEQLADLELSYVGATETKAAIDGATFPTDGKIGLFLFKDEAATTPYGESGYANIKYSYNSTKGKWTADPSIKVGRTPGYLYGYYPYKADTQEQPINVKAIPVESSLNGDDVMYATPVKDVTDQTATQTAITMNHALARVAIKVVNNGYTGEAKLSKIKLEGAEIAPSGTLNATDGSISAKKSSVILDIPTANQAITAGGTTYECLLVPSKIVSDKQEVTLTLTIDGKDKTANLSGANGVIIAQNTKSNITITLSNTGITVQTVSVENWNVVEVGGHKVTVKVADDVTAGDIMFAPYVDGDKVIIRANSFLGKGLKCDVDNNAQCERTLFGGTFIFTVREISSNIEAVLDYAPPATLTVSSDGNGKVWIGDDESKTSGQYEYGQKITVHAATDNQFRLFKWNDNGRELTKTITMGLTDTTYSASFISSDLIPGLFTVNTDDKKVFFSKGNLYCSGVDFHMVNDDYYRDVESMDNAQWGFESNQYDTSPSSSPNKINIHHISHFWWCSTPEKAMSYNYYSDYNNETMFFAEKNFTVNGFSDWSTLTKDEWNYLLNTRTMENSKPRYTIKDNTITLDGNNFMGLFIYPDDYSGEEVGNETETWTWDKINSEGIVFLPAAGSRSEGRGDQVENVGYSGFYWFASLSLYPSSTMIYALNVPSPTLISPSSRGTARSIRLVTEYQSEPSEE